MDKKSVIDAVTELALENDRLKAQIAEMQGNHKQTQTSTSPGTQLQTYDWEQAFQISRVMRCAGSTCEVTPLAPQDVDLIIGITEGENDGDAWRIAGQMKDGRWFYLNAWCDFTGWDCQAGGQAWVADSYDALLQFGVPDDDRSLWRLA